MQLDAQAVELNETITAANPHVFAMLSDKGRSIFFPKRGILSQSAEAQGKEINATIGTALEDNGAPMALEALVRQINVQNKALFGYAPSPGKPDIRAKWKEMLAKKNPSLASAPIGLPVVTSALTHGLSMAAYLFAGKNDTIIMPDLYWENYDLIFTQAHGARIKTFPMFKSGGFNIDGLSKALSRGKPGKKIVLLNFPNNPTGYTCTDAEGVALHDLLVSTAQAGNDVVVLVDDAYFGLVFEEGIMKESLFAKLASAHERLLAVKFDGPTKEDYVWGFRVGFVTFGCGKNTPALYSALEAKLAGAIRGNISNASNVGQTLLMTAYSDAGYDAERAEKYGILKRRFDKMKEVFAAHREYAKVFVPLPYNSGYFMCVRIKSGDAEAVRQQLLKQYSTGVIAFGSIIRIAFSATPLSMIEKLMANIYAAATDVRGASDVK